LSVCLPGSGVPDWSESGFNYKPTAGVPTATLVNTTTAHHLTAVVKQETYTVLLKGFKDKSAVNLVVVVENGLEFPLGLIPSFEGPAQEWQWTVGAFVPAEHYVTIKAYQPLKTNQVAYTPQIMVHDTAFEHSLTRFLEESNLSPTEQQNVHPALPAAYDRLRHLLSTTATRTNLGRRRKKRT